MEHICDTLNPNGLLAIFTAILRTHYIWKGDGMGGGNIALRSILHAWIKSNQPYENPSK